MMKEYELSANDSPAQVGEVQERGGEAPAAGAGESSAEDTAVLDLAARLEQLADERDRLEGEKAALSDLVLRRAAEFDNFRKRHERERAELIEYASADAARALLPVLDDFERALKADPAGEEYARGVQLIYQRLSDTLKKLGLEPVEAAGKPFDPNFHHAVETAAGGEAEEGTVVAELARGYTFKGRLLRPAMVRVAADG
jgi:molecular chaperone GrpE